MDFTVFIHFSLHWKIVFISAAKSIIFLYLFSGGGITYPYPISTEVMVLCTKCVF